MSISVARNGEVLTEYDEVNFRAAVGSGEVLPTDHYWTEGMPDWAEVHEYGELPSPAAPARSLPDAGMMARTVRMEAEPESPRPNTSSAAEAGTGPLAGITGAFRRLFRKG